MFNWIAEQFEKVVGNFFGWIASAFARLASTVFEWMISLALGEAPNYDAAFLSTWYGRIFAIALPIIVILAAVEITRGALAGRAAASAKTAFIGSMKAVIATFLGLPVVALIGGAVDALCHTLWTKSQGDVDEAVGQIRSLYDSLDVNSPLDGIGAANVAVATPVAAALLFILITFFSLLAATFLWFVLTIRTHLLYICVAALPLAFSGMAGFHTRDWPKKIMMFIGALAFSKIGIVVILGMGLSALGDVTSSQTSVAAKLSAAISMTAFTTIGGFMPFLAFKLFDFVGGEIMAESASRQALSPIQRAGETLKGALGAGLAGATPSLAHGGGELNTATGGSLAPTGGETDSDNTGTTAPASDSSDGANTGASTSLPPSDSLSSSDSAPPSTSPGEALPESASGEPESLAGVEDAALASARSSSPFEETPTDTRPREGGGSL